MTMMGTFLLLLLVGAIGIASFLWRKLRQARAGHIRELAEQRARYEATLQQQTARMEAMFDGMIEGLVILDGRGRIALANRAAEMMFSFSRMMIGGTLLQAI